MHRTSSRNLVRPTAILRPSPGATVTATADVRRGADAPDGPVPVGLEQPYHYRRRELVEPDWTRLPGFRDVTAQEWAVTQWQRAHCVKNVRQLRELLGDLVEDRLFADLERDHARGGDALDEPAETFRLVLSGSDEIGDAEGVATVADDDAPPVAASPTRLGRPRAPAPYSRSR